MLIYGQRWMKGGDPIMCGMYTYCAGNCASYGRSYKYTIYQDSSGQICNMDCNC